MWRWLALTALSASGASGNIQAVSIEIDCGVDGTNLYPDQGPDWVKDSAPNTDIGSLTGNIAVGIIPGLTGAVGDGIAGNDKDIFLTGGKENDPSTWNIGPGTVGSSKYDSTQAYLANNREYLYFGMERRGKRDDGIRLRVQPGAAVFQVHPQTNSRRRAVHV